MKAFDTTNKTSAKDAKYFLITIDVEDWFQVENFKPWIPFETWDKRELRVEGNVHRLLDLFDSIQLPPKDEYSVEQFNPTGKIGLGDSKGSIQLNKVRATFFVLGWLAKRLPHMVRTITSRGHEVASHGYSHELCSKIKPEHLRKDLSESKKLLEDTTGEPVLGYRAPSFSIDNETLLQVMDAGYWYDSSWNSFGMHGRYGRVQLSCKGNGCIPMQLAENFYEIPISNVTVSKPFGIRKPAAAMRDRFVLPWGGGGYFRVIPSTLFHSGVKNLFKKFKAYVFYMHPWEIDPGQPRVKEATLQYRIRHYKNLKHTASKLEKLIHTFESCNFMSCSEYLDRSRMGVL